MVFFPVIQRIDFCAAESGHIHKPIRSSAKEASVGAVNQSRPVGKHQSSAVFHISTKLFFVSVLEHICHRSRHNFIIGKGMFHCDHIHIQPLFSQRAVVLLHIFTIMHIFISRSLYICDRPVIFTVIEYRCLRLHVSSNRFLNLFQSFSNLCHFFKYAGIISAIMVNYRSMELFRSATALAELEVQNTV